MLITRLSMTLYWLFFYFWNSLLTRFHSTLLIALFLFCPSLPNPYCWVHFSYPYCLLVFLKCQFSPHALCSFQYYFSAKNFSHPYIEYRPLPELRVSTASFTKMSSPNFKLHIFISLYSFLQYQLLYLVIEGHYFGLQNLFTHFSGNPTSFFSWGSHLFLTLRQVFPTLHSPVNQLTN